MDTKEFFKQRYSRNELSDSDCDSNYMDLFAIDSIGLIILIGDLEDQFGVRFTDDDFKNIDFKTINGIEKLIKNKKGN